MKNYLPIITFTVDDYQQVIQKYQLPRMSLFEDLELDTYWRRLPNYIIARCPFCNKEYVSLIDTHSIFEWWTGVESHKSVFTSSYQTIGCSHFVAVQTFLNLNGLFPFERNYFSNKCGDVPIITPELFFKDLRTHAVIHSLPICRIEGKEFVPRYTIYTITYYSENSESAYDRAMDIKYPPELMKQQLELDDGYSPGYLFSSSTRARLQPLVRDLRSWVLKGNLFWLDLHDPNLPLSNNLEAFPYQNIQGFGEPFIYRKRPKPRWWWQQKNWHPDGEIWDESERKILARPNW